MSNDSQTHKCDVFKGTSIKETFSATYPHVRGGLAFYNGKPTTVGHQKELFQPGKVETLTSTGWMRLPDHPKYVKTGIFSATLI